MNKKISFPYLMLAVIVGRHLDIEHTLEMKQIKLTTFNICTSAFRPQ
jgi:hypothetical protein